MISARAPYRRRPAPRHGRISVRPSADPFVAADVIRVRMRVDDVADGSRRQLTERRQHRISVLRRARIHENRAESHRPAR